MISKNTGQEFDGSDSGARPDEAVSWGKIRAGAEAIKVSFKCRCLGIYLTSETGVCGRYLGLPSVGRRYIRTTDPKVE